MIFAVAALIEFAFVVAIQRIEQIKKCKKEPQMDRLPDIEKELFSEGITFRIRNKDNALVNSPAKNECQDKERKKTAELPSLSIDKIDFLAFWSFLFVYILFNVFYWVLYLPN